MSPADEITKQAVTIKSACEERDARAQRERTLLPIGARRRINFVTQKIVICVGVGALVGLAEEAEEMAV